MKKTSNRKLVLRRETLRTLGKELANVRGGGSLAMLRSQMCLQMDDSSACSLNCPTETLSN